MPGDPIPLQPGERIRPPSDKIRALAEKLIGTTGPGELIDLFNDLERWECRQLDMLCFACEACGWWFAATERKIINDAWFCAECAKEGRT